MKNSLYKIGKINNNKNMINKYSKLSDDEMENHFSNFIIERWSYSALRTFSRNEKDFEMRYIYKIFNNKRGASAIAGTIYHEVVSEFFENFDKNKIPDLDTMLISANKKIDFYPRVDVKPKKNHDIEQTMLEVQKMVNVLITNFCKEFDSYLDDIQEVVFNEEPIETFVRICNEDIPLPVKIIPDLVYVDKNGELATIDHKSKRSYTKEEDVNLFCSGQSTIYKIAIDAIVEAGELNNWIKKYPKIRNGLKNFYYYENKVSINRDKTRQIRRIKIDFDESMEIYERMLYENVKKMIVAVNDPDYIYLMNPDDMFIDSSELVDFWLKTKLDNLNEFENLSKKQKKFLKKRKLESRKIGNMKVPKNFIEKFKNPKKFISFNPKTMENNLTKEQIIEHRLRYFNIQVEVAEKISGYACDTYLLRIGAGTRVASVFKASYDIASALGVESVIISPKLVRKNGESFVAVDVNKEDEERKFAKLPKCNKENNFMLGKSNYGDEIIWDLDNPSTPHLMISGASGSGKSILLKAIIDQAKSKKIDYEIIDPKYEFREASINNNEDVLDFLLGKIDEMDKIFKSREKNPNKQIIFFDECADSFSRKLGKNIKEAILILSQKARSAGIHIVLSSQRFSTKILTGDVKANFTTRVALTCAKEVDSRVMLDEAGAEKLAGKGDALIVSPEFSEPLRFQAYISS